MARILVYTRDCNDRDLIDTKLGTRFGLHFEKDPILIGATLARLLPEFVILDENADDRETLLEYSKVLGNPENKFNVKRILLLKDTGDQIDLDSLPAELVLLKPVNFEELISAISRFSSPYGPKVDTRQQASSKPC